ncbi:hypothetical protein MMC21_006572, partial [Puttea exsequens]|nr:hypothetical protein [Puttea exsequens]
MVDGLDLGPPFNGSGKLGRPLIDPGDCAKPASDDNVNFSQWLRSRSPSYCPTQVDGAENVSVGGQAMADQPAVRCCPPLPTAATNRPHEPQSISSDIRNRRIKLRLLPPRPPSKAKVSLRLRQPKRAVKSAREALSRK